MGNKIAYYRKLRGISQKDLSFAMNVTQSRISEWERGVRVPALYTGLKIAQILQASAEDIFPLPSN